MGESGVYIAPSFLGVPPEDENSFFKGIKDNGAMIAHADVVDLGFVEQKAVATDRMELCRLSNLALPLYLDFHLMVNDIIGWLDFIQENILLWPNFLECSPYIAVHLESTGFNKSILERINKTVARSGIAIKPETPVSAIEDFLPLVKLVTVMTVNPGISGQAMIMYCLKKVKQLQELKRKRGYKFFIEVDGGVNLKTSQKAIEAGADILVSGGFVQKDPTNIKLLKKLKE